MVSSYKNRLKNLYSKSNYSFLSASLLLNFFIFHADAAGASTTTSASNFGISITGLYLEPNADNLGYAVYTTPLPLPAPNWYQKNIRPHFNGSFDLGMQYNFSDRKNQIALDWLHFYSNNSAAFAAQPGTSVGPSYYFGPAEQFLPNTNANSTATFNINQINLVLGHFFTLFNHFKVEPIFGIGSTILKENIADHYAGRDPVYGPYTHSTYINSQFAGAGPRLGFEGQYFILSNFGIDATMAASMLLGELSTSTNFTSWTSYVGTVAHNNTPTNTTLSNLSQPKIVPDVESKIGLFYKIKTHSGSAISMNAGYMFSDYINSISQITPTSLVPGSWETGTVAIISQAQNRSDLSLNGPYLKLTWQFA